MTKNKTRIIEGSNKMGKFLFDKQKGKGIFFSNKKLKELARITNNEYHRKPEVKNKRRIKNIQKSINYWENKIKDWKVELEDRLSQNG